MTELTFTEVVDGDQHTVGVSRLLVAGFTGRDRESVDEHIDELEAMGVPVPDTVPSLYGLDPAQLTQGGSITVEGDNTSGEVEPVVIRFDGRWLLTAGSDHTDRDLEREDIQSSKAACPKVVAATCLALSRVQRWDDVEITSRIDGGDVLYQRARLALLLPLEDILGRLADEHGVTPTDGDVIFLGTVPVRGGIRSSPTFEATLHAPGTDRVIMLSYSVTQKMVGHHEEEG